MAYEELIEAIETARPMWHVRKSTPIERINDMPSKAALWNGILVKLKAELMEPAPGKVRK